MKYIWQVTFNENSEFKFYGSFQFYSKFIFITLHFSGVLVSHNLSAELIKDIHYGAMGMWKICEMIQGNF